jgi:hypothetical protein
MTAPTNEAFNALPGVETFFLSENIEKLQDIVKSNVVCGLNNSSSLTSGDLKTLNGDFISVTSSDSGIVVNDANVLSADIMASNGVIHVIDKVLLPPSDDCLPDRFDNDQMDLVDPTINFNKLYPGQFICSRPYSANRYRFGVTQSGNVVWMDTSAQGETVTLFENKHNTDIYFSLRVDATMVVTDVTTRTVLWESSPVNLKHPMSHYPRCLSDHDCPYFHLHSDGVLVMNYIPDDGAGWQAKQMFQVYGV